MLTAVSTPKGKRRRNPLRFDPSRTGLIRRQFSAELIRRFERIRSAVWQLVAKQDVFGLVQPEPPTILYDPSQPRVPAGSPEGGQWISGAMTAVPEPFRSELTVRVMKTGRGSMRVGREIRIEPELFTKGKKAVEHDIFHEVGHFMSSRLTKAAREEAEQYAGKIKTPVTEKYRRYLEEQSMAGIFSASLDRKMSDEQLAEMFRQHLQEGKHRSLVKRLKFTESAGEMPAPRPYKKGEKVQRIFGGEKQTGTVSAVQVHKPTGRQYIKLKGDKKWHPFDWWNPVENFDPNQPRAPAGTPEGGQWVDEDGDDLSLDSVAQKMLELGVKKVDLKNMDTRVARILLRELQAAPVLPKRVRLHTGLKDTLARSAFKYGASWGDLDISSRASQHKLMEEEVTQAQAAKYSSGLPTFSDASLPGLLRHEIGHLGHRYFGMRTAVLNDPEVNEFWKTKLSEYSSVAWTTLDERNARAEGIAESYALWRAGGEVPTKLGDEFLRWHDGTRPIINYDPNQPRDEQGRWTDEGGGGGVSVPTMAPADRSAVGPPKWSIAVGRTHQRYIRQFQDVLDRAGFLDRKHPLWFRDGQTGQGAEANYRRGQAYENAPDSTPGIVLARRLGSSDTILHEYGHHVDWIMGGAQYLRYSEEQERGVYWSDRRLPEWIQFKGQVESENRKMCREIMADAFLHYVTKGTTSGLWVGGLKQGKTQEEFHTWLDAEFAKARDLFTTNVVTNAPGPKAFQFKTKDEKLKSFNRWFADLVNQGILEVDRTTRPWLAKYVESAYKKGAIRSYLEAHKKELGRTADFYAGTREQFLRSAFETPERMSKLKLLGTRAFEELKGISAEMSRQMSRVLADGMAHGKGPYEIARTMSNTITGIERKRAKVLARTEIIHAHAEGQLDGYEEMGVEEVSVDVEWSTAGDDLVCELCDEMEGEVFTIDEARGLIPKHPNCRCAWKPHLQKLKRGK